MAATAHRAPARDHARTRPGRAGGSPSPRAPRRVSGPSRPKQEPRAQARTVSATAPAITLPRPSLPSLPRPRDVLRGLPDARWLDRLVRGQGWIVLIGIALIGIVAMQVSLLKMNAGIGASIERSGELERKNADLRADVSKLSSEERIQQVAGRLGLVMPHAGDVDFVRTRPGEDGARASRTMRAPDPDATVATTTAPAGSTAEAIAQGQPVTPTAPAAGTATTAPPETVTPTATGTPSATPAPAATPQAQTTTPAPATQSTAPPAPGGTAAAPSTATSE